VRSEFGALYWPRVKVARARGDRQGHADRFWSVALACQKERGPLPGAVTEIQVRVIG
jgi:hypothetical protein